MIAVDAIRSLQPVQDYYENTNTKPANLQDIEQIMDVIEKVLGCIAGGRVLDVATQEGGFVQILIENLQDYTEIVGVDINERVIETAQGAMGQEDIRFLVMNAEQLDFKDESFDTVSISASLHHLSDIRRALEEMERVLRTMLRVLG
jgi:ubiquinone/menaquinone biosynthesis C-methylase UbiE